MIRNPVDVLIRRTDPEVPLPSYGHPGDAGADLVTTEAADLAPGERAVLPTGVSSHCPTGTPPSCIRDPGWPRAAEWPW